MIALDTNVLVRYLVRDDAKQTALASALIRRTIDAGDDLFIADVAMCEVVWVLSVAYRFGKPEIVAVLRDLLRARHVVFGSKELLVRAVGAYDTGKGDFATYLIREEARGRGCEHIATFDRALLRETGFVAVG